MNKNIDKLYALSNKPFRNIIGLMSGTSVDGLDVALCNIEGSGINTRLKLIQFETVAFDINMKAEVKSVFSKKMVNLEKLTILNAWIAMQHAAIINTLLVKWEINKEEVDLIASHGQTIYHAPKSLHRQSKFGNATLQIGDGDHLAVATGIITLSDFRQKHIAAGGEGAPLAVYADHILFSTKGEDRILLNIGGIANFTYLPGKETNAQVLCTDVGPGNTMMDTYMQQQFPGEFYDKDAAVAKAGNINGALLYALKENDFFTEDLPKSTGPELFNLAYLSAAKKKSGTENLSAENTMATLNRFSAETIAEAMKTCIQNKESIQIFTSGGGIHNPMLMQHLQELLPGCIFKSSENQGINPDAKEAILFALLANECVSGNTSTFASFGPAIPAVSMGKISFPT